MKRHARKSRSRIALMFAFIGIVALSAQDKSKVHINRTVPKVTPPPSRPIFSDPPTTEDITHAWVFEEPLLPLGGQPSTDENRELAALLSAYLDAGVPDGTQDLEQFAAAHSSSPWRASLLTDLGLVWRRTGHFSKAYRAWELAWQLAKDENNVRGHQVADKALGEFVELSARLGHFDELTALFSEIEGRPIRGAAAEKISGAKQAVWLMNNEVDHSFRCGPLGLDAVLRATAGRAGYDTPKPIQMCLSTKRGTSLVAMRDLAKEVGTSMTMGLRPPGAPVVVPALVHWRVGHFAALVQQMDDKYLVQDPTFGNELWVSQATLDEEASGYFLIRSQALPAGWRSVSDKEGGSVWGKGNPAGIDASDLGPYPCPVGPPCCGSATCGGPSMGMPVMGINQLQVALTVTDTPLWYTPPKGPAVEFRLTYNQREGFQPQSFFYANVGPRWTLSWLSYLNDDPSNPAAPLTMYQPGGGVETITGYDAGTQSYSPTIRAQAVIRRTSTSPIRYERELPDGSVQVYGVSNNSFPRYVFLSEVRDPQGNALTFTFDSQFRIVAVTDAIGQVTTLEYNGNQITQVTDPFGRTATIAYGDFGGGISSITDMLGLTSTFVYHLVPCQNVGLGLCVDIAIESMTTPYGTTTADVGEATFTRWAETTDPLGGKERVEYGYGTATASEPVPTGMSAALPDNHHDTFYWDKRAMATAPGVTSAATEYYWALGYNLGFQAVGVPLSVKRPLERRVYYSYQGGGSNTEGTVRQVTGIGRVLDDGTSQVWAYQYNARGRVTQAIDPLGRETDYAYATNGLDLIQVKQKRGVNWDILETRTYNSQHEPLTVTDAAGQTTTFTYNAAGQVLTVTNAKNETTTYAYDMNGYLLTATGALAGATTTFGFDAYGRMNSVTDSEGYQVTTVYDIANRPVQRTYPDGTTEQVVYDRLDVQQQRDRLGRITTFTYDAARRLTALRDPLGRRVIQQWCTCGSLDTLVDAAGNQTQWSRDLEGRVTAETRANGAVNQYTYENTTSRVKRVTDRKGQVTTYDYFVDDRFKQKTFSNSAVATPSVSVSYDPNYPRLATMTDGTGTTAFTYESVAIGQLGSARLMSIDGPLADDTIDYTYDELARVASRSINSVAESTTYDAIGRVATVSNVLGSFGYTYVGNSDRLRTVTYPNGQTNTYSYFGHTVDDRPQSIVHQRADTTTISRFDYAYDSLGHIATWNRQSDISAATQYQFAYDAGDQLLAATKQTTDPTPSVLMRYRYGFDRSRNRTSEQIDDAVTGAIYNGVNELVSTQPAGGVYFSGSVSELATVTIAGQGALVAADNTFSKTVALSAGTNTVAITATDPSGNATTKSYQVTTSGSPTSFTYDANGNLTSDGTRTFTYDADDRLVSVTAGTHSSAFTYDGLDRRVRTVETDNGSTTSDTRLVWCDLMICELRDSTGTTVLKRYFANGAQDNGNPYFYTRDHLNSVRELTDTTGTVRARYDYDPWGRQTKVSGDKDADFGFTGHQTHGPSGLVLAPFRAYDPTLGSWIGEDPIGLSGGINLHGYVANDPTTERDAAGFWSPGAHDALLDSAFQGILSKADIDILKRSSRDFDANPDNQSQARSYMHSMMASWQKPEDAMKQRDDFVNDKIAQACRAARRGNRTEALWWLGQALHPVMDWSSPMHTDNYGNPIVWLPWYPWGHSPNDWIGSETVKRLTPPIFEQENEALQDAYRRVFF